MTSRSNARVQAPLNGLFPPPLNDDPSRSARTSQSNVSLEEDEDDYTEDLGEDEYVEDDDEFADDDQFPGITIDPHVSPVLMSPQEKQWRCCHHQD